MDIGAVGAAGAQRFQPVRPTQPEAPNAGGSGVDEAPGFAEMLEDGITAVADAERQADDLAQRFAVGDPSVQIQDVTVATTEAGLSVQLMVAVRDRALEAYQQVINLQV
ncbi:MAG: flagellar hook-basal body complex protein FliE [Actinomycetota bacterium]